MVTLSVDKVSYKTITITRRYSNGVPSDTKDVKVTSIPLSDLKRVNRTSARSLARRGEAVFLLPFNADASDPNNYYYLGGDNAYYRFQYSVWNISEAITGSKYYRDHLKFKYFVHRDLNEKPWLNSGKF